MVSMLPRLVLVANAVRDARRIGIVTKSLIPSIRQPPAGGLK